MMDVLIVGAGPTGLTMALECARFGLSFRIIDQAAKPSQLSKALAIQARTLEIFQHMGIHERFLDAGLYMRAGNIHSGNLKRARIDLRLIDSPFNFVLCLEQYKTEKFLEDAFVGMGGVVERSSKLLSYEESEQGIVAHTDQGDIRARYLIGCDGTHSIVRKAMGCAFQGKTFKDIFSLADVEIQWDRPHDELNVFLESNGMMALFPLPEEKRYRLVFQLDRLQGKFKPHQIEQGVLKSSEEEEPTLEEIQDLARMCIGESCVVSNPRWITNFHINSRLSNHCRKGNVLIAGDAAHIHSPIGGQGMNTGIQDAFNLAWKLFYVQKGFAKDTLLDSYEKERHGLGKLLLQGTERASSIVGLRSPFLVFIRNHLLSFLLSFHQVQKELVKALAELNISSPKERAPNFPIVHDGRQTDFFTLRARSSEYHLLCFNSSKPEFKSPHIKVIDVQDDKKPRALLVRPDGYIELEDCPPFKKVSQFIKVSLPLSH